MNKSFSVILTILSFLFFVVPQGESAEISNQVEPGQAEAIPSVMSNSENRHAKDELRWRKQLSDTKAQRTGLLIAGISGAVAGTVVLVKGVTEFSEAEDTPGCSRNGNEILCNDEASRATAQDKLDSGRSKMVVGLVVMGIGAGLSVWGVARGNEANRLERLGKRKGYKVNLTTQGRDGMSLVMSKSF